MQENLMQIQTQPFIKLAQANMDLFTRFSTSPEVTGQAMDGAANLFQQATDTATKLLQSGAFSQMMQGLYKNYTEFWADLSRSGMDMMNSGQAALMQQAQEVTQGVAEVTDARGHRSRRAS